MSQPTEDFSLEEAETVLRYLDVMHSTEYNRRSDLVAADLNSTYGFLNPNTKYTGLTFI